MTDEQLKCFAETLEGIKRGDWMVSSHPIERNDSGAMVTAFCWVAKIVGGVCMRSAFEVYVMTSWYKLNVWDQLQHQGNWFEMTIAKEGEAKD